MRLAFVTPEFVTEARFNGGLANYLGRITVALAKANHDVHVITTSHETASFAYREAKVHRVVPCWDRRMTIDRVDTLVPRSFYGAYQDLKAAWCLSRKLKALHRYQPFDVVQIANVSAVGLFLRGMKDLPVVLRMSCFRPAWDVATGCVPTVGLRLRWKLEEWNARSRPFVYAPSQFVARQVARAYCLPRVDVLESPFFQPEPEQDFSAFNEFGRGRDYGFFFGHLTQMKGAHVLAAALPQLLTALPDLRFIFVGTDGIAPTGGSMRAYIRRSLGKDVNRVALLDPVKHDKLYPLLEHSRFVVLPSLIDNLPNTCLEAMGLGKVVIATKGSCFEQLINHGSSGLLVPPSDAAALTEAMLTAARMSADEQSRIGTAAKERIRRLHPDHTIPQLLEYYRRILEEFDSGRAEISATDPSAGKHEKVALESSSVSCPPVIRPDQFHC